jgi:hypothetical protein
MKRFLPLAVSLGLAALLGSCGDRLHAVPGSFRISLVHPRDGELESGLVGTNDVNLAGFHRLPAHPSSAAGPRGRQLWVADGELLRAADLRQAEILYQEPVQLSREQFEEAMRRHREANPADTNSTTYDDYARKPPQRRATIHLTFTSTGKERFAEVTRTNIGRQLAIVVGGHVITAPIIREEIAAGVAQISGHFTEAEARAILDRIHGKP